VPVRTPDYDARMPVYEFLCSACGERFEELVALGTESAPCPECSTNGAERVLSVPAPTARLVKSRGEARKQEGRNEKLRTKTKADFKARRARARARAKGGDG
jgi:putative FmdB family regulatory protein